MRLLYVPAHVPFVPASPTAPTSACAPPIPLRAAASLRAACGCTCDPSCLLSIQCSNSTYTYVTTVPRCTLQLLRQRTRAACLVHQRAPASARPRPADACSKSAWLRGCLTPRCCAGGPRPSPGSPPGAPAHRAAGPAGKENKGIQKLGRYAMWHGSTGNESWLHTVLCRPPLRILSAPPCIPPCQRSTLPQPHLPQECEGGRKGDEGGVSEADVSIACTRRRHSSTPARTQP